METIKTISAALVLTSCTPALKSKLLARQIKCAMYTSASSEVGLTTEDLRKSLLELDPDSEVTKALQSKIEFSFHPTHYMPDEAALAARRISSLPLYRQAPKGVLE